MQQSGFWRNFKVSINIPNDKQIYDITQNSPLRKKRDTWTDNTKCTIKAYVKNMHISRGPN